MRAVIEAIRIAVERGDIAEVIESLTGLQKTPYVRGDFRLALKVTVRTQPLRERRRNRSDEQPKRDVVRAAVRDRFLHVLEPLLRDSGISIKSVDVVGKSLRKFCLQVVMTGLPFRFPLDVMEIAIGVEARCFLGKPAC